MARTPHRRDGVITPESPDGLDVGLNDKEIPGGQPHIANQPAASHAPLPVTHAPYYGGIMAHGVIAPERDAGASWKRLSAPGGKSLADLAREHAMTAGGLVEAARASLEEPGGLTRSELDEFARQLAQGTGQPLAPGLVYVIPLHGAAGRITGLFHERGADAATRAVQPIEDRRPQPVPVYITEAAGGARALRKATTRRVTVPAAGSPPVLLCARDPHRYQVRLLNEDTANLVRFADNLSQLSGAQGQITAAVLPAVTNAYLVVETQDVLYAVADAAAACIVSVIMEYDLPGGTS